MTQQNNNNDTNETCDTTCFLGEPWGNLEPAASSRAAEQPRGGTLGEPWENFLKDSLRILSLGEPGEPWGNLGGTSGEPWGNLGQPFLQDFLRGNLGEPRAAARAAARGNLGQPPAPPLGEPWGARHQHRPQASKNTLGCAYW